MKYVSLKNRLLLGTVVISTVITLAISAYQVNALQQREIALARQQFASFEQSAINSIREALWNYDWSMVETIAASQVNQIMTYIEICDAGGAHCVSSGRKGLGNTLEYHEEILYRFSPQSNELKIGTAYLESCYRPFLQYFDNTFLPVMLSYALGVFGVAISIFLLFHLRATRRLVQLERYTRNIDLADVEQLSTLSFAEHDATHDEVDRLADAIGGLVDRIKEEFTRRKELEKQLGQAQKMEALGTLAGGIAHDFNNILAAMLGYTQLCCNTAEPGSKMRNRLEQVINAGQRAKSLIAQILVFSRKEEEHTQNVRLAEVVEETLALARASLPATIRVDVDLDNDLWIVGEPTQLHQVIMNLISNAGHALKENGGGTLKISLTPCELDGETAAGLQLSPGDYVLLRFCDDGSGIDEAIRERIFEPFFTTKKTGEGTGMGLAVVHGIVQSHSGGICLDVQDRETCFSIYFPRSEVTNPVPQPAYTEPETGHEHILLIDDEPVVTDMGREMLQSLGYRVTTCQNPTEAHQLLAANADIDLVITDLTMPGQTGIEFAAEVRAGERPIPVVLWTGYLDLIDRSALNDGTIARLIHKPFSIELLAEVVRDVLTERDTRPTLA